jgi:hypothetical protein
MNMNATTTTITQGMRAPVSAGASANRRPPSEPERSRFERLMSEKSAGTHDANEANEAHDWDHRISADDAAPTDDPQGSPLPPSAPLPMRSALMPAMAGIGAVEAAAGGPRAVIQSALHAANDIAAAGGDQAAAQFEVSIQEQKGVAVELRGTRQGSGALGEVKAAWTLTIGSPVVDAAMLARQVPRLNERLQARAVTHSHIRIEDGRDGQHEHDR